MNATDLHARFLKHLPRIEAHAKYAFRRIECSHSRDDLEAETVALAWKLFVALVRRQKDPERFVTTLAMRCAQAARSGRKVAGGLRKRELMTQCGVARCGPKRIPLTDAEYTKAHWLTDALREDTRFSVPRRVAFKMDFEAWRAELSEKKQVVLDALAAGCTTSEVAEELGLSAGRISQMRGELADGWYAFRAS